MNPASSRIWRGLAALVVVSFAGNAICQAISSGGDREQKLRLGAEAIGRLPESFGTWRMAESQPLDEAARAMLQCRGDTSRVYTDAETGESVSLVLLAGPAGPLVAHTPEVCYSSTSFDVLESAHPESVRKTDRSVDEFNRVLFRESTVAGRRHRVYYAWRPFSGSWTAPNRPRLALGGQPMLYKLQIGAVEGMNSVLAGEGTQNDVGRRFLSDLLPILDEALSTR